MKKNVCIALVLLLAVYSMSCFGEETLVHRDELISVYGLEETEYLDDFILEFSPTRDYLKRYNIVQVYHNYLLRRYLELNDFSYLLGVERNKELGQFEAQDIRRILWFWNVDGEIEVRLFDLIQGRLYYGSDNFLSNIQQAETRDINTNEINAIVKDLNKFNIADWKEGYPSSVNDSTGYLYWRFLIEFTDGTYFVSSGSGNTADNLPSGYSEIKHILQGT